MTRHATDRFALGVVATVVGFSVAVVAGRPEAALLVVPWTVVLVLGLPGWRPPEIDVAIDVDRNRVLVGDEVEVTAEVRSDATTVVAIQILEGPGFRPSDAEMAAGSRLGPPPAAGTVTEVVTETQPMTARRRFVAELWGTHPLGRASIVASSPFDLFRWSLVVSDERAVRVHPHPRQVGELLTPHLVRRLAGAHPARTRDRGVEYADVRPFASGDSVRDINWRASARAGELWVSQRHPDRASDVVLLVDTFVESGHDVRTVFGLTIEAAVALAEAHLGVTDRVGLVQLGGVVRWVHLGTGRHALQRLTDALLATRLYATAAERDLDAVPARALPPRSFVVGISPLLDDRYVENLIELRAGGHDVAVIECVAPLSGESAPEVTGAYEAALRLWSAERAVVRDRLAGMGMVVGRWHEGASLDPVLNDMRRRRRLTPGRLR